MRLGVKASARDLDEMLTLEPDFVETFLGPDDLLKGTGDMAEAFGGLEIPVVIHCPEFHGGTFVDPASAHRRVHETSVEVMGLCAQLADELEASHVVLHPGGVVGEGETLDRGEAIGRLRSALEEVGYGGFFLENMPWFYFQARTRMVRSTIMVDPLDFEEVLDLIGGITIDVCHGYLSVEGGSMDYLMSFFDFFPSVPRYYHLSDARPPDGEGLQIGEGEIDFGLVLDRLRGTDAWAIPEIMGGHENGGEGFARALEILRDELG